MQILIYIFDSLHSYSFLSVRGIRVPFKYEFNPYQVHYFQSRIEQSELRKYASVHNEKMQLVSRDIYSNLRI